jgi:gingipain R
VAALTNGAKTPIVYSTNCLTGAFASAEDCLAEALMKTYPGGAVGVSAATEASTSGYNDLIVDGSYDCFWDDHDSDDGGNISPHSFGPADAYLYGKYNMYTWEGDSATTQRSFELFHWFGDPEMQAFTAVPTNQLVSLDPTIDAGASTMTVDVDVEGALVAVTESGTLVGRAVVTDGVAVVELDPPVQNPGTLDVVVTGHNVVPWPGTCEVVWPSSIFTDDCESGGLDAWYNVAS